VAAFRQVVVADRVTAKSDCIPEVEYNSMLGCQSTSELIASCEPNDGDVDITT
jgi:hypothetical protein